MNHHYKEIERLHHEVTLLHEDRGEILLGLEKRPGDKELQEQLAGTDANIAQHSKRIVDLQDQATAIEKQDKVAVAKAKADRVEAASKSCLTHAEAAKARAPRIDKAIDALLQLFTEQEKDLNAAFTAGCDLGIRPADLRYVLDTAPLGVALADRLARGGWQKLPFLDISNPRDSTSVEEMTNQRHKGLLTWIARARTVAT